MWFVVGCVLLNLFISIKRLKLVLLVERVEKARNVDYYCLILLGTVFYTT
jgi:hypothetical protein